MRIDAYTHFIPEKYFNKIVESGHADIGKRGVKSPASITSRSAARSSAASRTTRRSSHTRCRRLRR